MGVCTQIGRYLFVEGWMWMDTSLADGNTSLSSDEHDLCV